MTSTSSTTSPVVRVAIDIAKLTHQVLLELPTGKRRGLRVANTRTEIDRFVATLRALGYPCEVAFEPSEDRDVRRVGPPLIPPRRRAEPMTRQARRRLVPRVWSHPTASRRAIGPTTCLRRPP